MGLRLVLWPAGLALGAVSLTIAREDPALSFVGRSFGAAAALLGAGWTLLFCALAFWARRPRSAFGPVLAAASCTWFLAEWDNPGVGSAILFTIGLTLYAASPPLVAWAVLAYPSGRLGWSEGVAIGLALAASVLVLGLPPALFFDPTAQGCTQCPDNLVLVSDQPGLVDSLNRLGVRAGLVWSLLLLGLVGWRTARSSPARRRVVAPVVLAGGAYLGLVAATFAASLDRGFLGSGALERRLWLAQAAALVALALAGAWGLLRARRIRSSLARLVVELGESAPAGGLRDALARTLGDPALVIAYSVRDGRYVDASGRPVDADRLDGRAATQLLRDGHPVAMLLHRTDLAENPELIEEVASAARLALENERLQAEVRAQLEDLRSSRTRIVEAGDAERRSLERDLHDGAQQRLVGLSLALRLVRTQLGSDPDEQLAARLAEAESELRRTLAELRKLAHGIHPALLSDEGFAAAVEALAEETAAPLHIDGLPEERFPPAVETAGYLVVAQAARSGAARVSAARRDGTLVVDVDAEAEPEGLVDLEDRVGALDGTLAVERVPGGGVRIRAEIPCG